LTSADYLDEVLTDCYEGLKKGLIHLIEADNVFLEAVAKYVKEKESIRHRVFDEELDAKINQCVENRDYQLAVDYLTKKKTLSEKDKKKITLLQKLADKRRKGL
jgi:predicted RNA-binding protein with RPS1 domain